MSDAGRVCEFLKSIFCCGNLWSGQFMKCRHLLFAIVEAGKIKALDGLCTEDI